MSPVPRVSWAVAIVREPRRAPLHLIVGKVPVEVGRACAGLLLTDPQLSRRHLMLESCAGGIRVTDLGSTNGTLVNDRPLHGSVVLEPGHMLRAGAITVVVADLCGYPGFPIAWLDGERGQR